ncbi:Mss4-like protein [Infundibulicybe gibba]|nr:Mss4-like protein [Infundibulicybe gibba]KAF8879407.1 Mss4-like protein [Infundibulicybe gibba]
MPHTGSCLCGQTKVTIASTLKNQTLCHCTDCRKTSGSAFSVGALVKREDVTIEGPVKDFVFAADAGYEVTQTFCANCGTTISQVSPARPGMQGVGTGILDDFVTIPIGAEVFVKSRCAALKALDGVAQFTTLPGK